MARRVGKGVDANDVMGVVEWALGSIVALGILAFGWLHRQHRELERRVARLEQESEALEPIRNILDEESLMAARRLGRGVKR